MKERKGTTPGGRPYSAVVYKEAGVKKKSVSVKDGKTVYTKITHMSPRDSSLRASTKYRYKPETYSKAASEVEVKRGPTKKKK